MPLLEERQLAPGCTVQVVMGDITDERTDAIVNAANERLRHGGGVAGAISRRGGPSIQEESDAFGFVPTGTAVVTGAGALHARYVIHAVGPVWHGGGRGEEALLASAVKASLTQAAALGLHSISIPAISSGIFGYPKTACAGIILETIRMFGLESGHAIELVRCVNIDRETSEIFAEALRRIE